MEYGDQVEAVAPVFLKIGIQECGMSQVAVHDSPGYRRRAADALPVLDGDAGGLHFKMNPVSYMFSSPAIFEAIQVASLLLRVCAETEQGRAAVADGEADGVLVGVLGEGRWQLPGQLTRNRHSSFSKSRRL